MMQKKESWKKTRLVVMLAFIINGILMATWASRIPAVQEKLALSDGELGIILAGFSAGLVTALLISAGLISRFGSRRIFHLSTFICCLTLPSLMLISHPILLFCCSVFVWRRDQRRGYGNERASCIRRKRRGTADDVFFSWWLQRGRIIRGNNRQRNGRFAEFFTSHSFFDN